MAESGTESATVPIKVSAPEQGAPPTLAEPASGPVAEMSGALPSSDKNAAAPASVAEATVATEPDTSANGTTQTPSEPAGEKSAEPSQPATSEAPAADDDTEMKDAPESASETRAAPETNGSAAEKKTPNGKRKSIGGVPEHKSKKLNKKKSMQKITHLDAEPGNYYIARLKSFPPWPSIICDEDMLPSSLLTTRPMTTKKADGTYNESYADGGKKVMDRTYPIMFLHTNEFAWIPNTDLTPLDPADCKDVNTKSKSKQLLAAYEVAAEGHELQFFKDMLMDHARAIQEDEDYKEAQAAEKAAKAEKKKRKSEAKVVVDEDVDMADADAEPTTKKASKKRKKEAETDDEAPEKPAKTPKTTKLKLTTNKTPVTEKKVKEPKSAKAKPEKKSKKVASDEEAVEAQKEKEDTPLDPVEARKAREKEVLFLRHKLQKGFLARDQAPREEEMPQMSNYIKKLEVYADLEVAIIRGTKINKVLKAIVKLNTIPKDEEFQFRKRSVELLAKWNKILGTEAEPIEKDKASPATNGVHGEKEKSEEAAEEKDEVEEPKEKVAEPAEAIEKISAEVPADAEAKASVIESLEKEVEPEKKVDSEVPEASADDGKKDEAPAEPERVPESASAAHAAQEIVKASE